MEDVSSLVARQYEAFAYPEPFADLEEAIRGGYSQIGDPSRYAPVLWPRGKPPGKLKILVAGCGTVQAAYTAFVNRDDEVVGIDLSQASLAHERFLQERHGLTICACCRAICWSCRRSASGSTSSCAPASFITWPILAQA